MQPVQSFGTSVFGTLQSWSLRRTAVSECCLSVSVVVMLREGCAATSVFHHFGSDHFGPRTKVT